MHTLSQCYVAHVLQEFEKHELNWADFMALVGMYSRCLILPLVSFQLIRTTTIDWCVDRHPQQVVVTHTSVRI